MRRAPAGKILAELLLQDCYRILGVPPDAGAVEIKRAFREKAKRLHPDTAGYSRKARDTAAEMRILLEAYHILSDAETRARFAGWRAQQNTGFDYRSWLLEREDGESRAKLIFYDLLHDLEAEAADLYLRLRRAPGSYSLAEWLDRGDFMDCAFLLAEELAQRGELYEAFRLLAETVVLEHEKPYFRHFFPEALAFLRTLLAAIGPDTMPDELVLDCLQTALELRLGRKDDIRILRRMAECCKRLGDALAAGVCSGEADRLERLGRQARTEAVYTWGTRRTPADTGGNT